MVPELLKSIAGSLTRWALTGIAAYLVSKGIVKGEDTEMVVAGAGMGLAALAWSLWQKYKDRLNFLAALSMPPTSSEADVKREAQARGSDISLWLILILLAPIGLSACGDKDGKDTLRGVAKALHRVANATARADEVTHRFFLDGIVSAQDAEQVSIVLLDINRASAAFQKKARTYSTFDTEAQTDILKLASDTRDYVNGRIADGTARIKDARAQQEWRAIVNTAYDAFASIVMLVRSAKPAPTPAPTGFMLFSNRLGVAHG